MYVYSDWALFLQLLFIVPFFHLEYETLIAGLHGRQLNVENTATYQPILSFPGTRHCSDVYNIILSATIMLIRNGKNRSMPNMKQKKRFTLCSFVIFLLIRVCRLNSVPKPHARHSTIQYSVYFNHASMHTVLTSYQEGVFGINSVSSVYITVITLKMTS